MLLPKKDGGMRPVAIANTIVRVAKAYALFLDGDVFAKIFEEDKLQQGAAPAGPDPKNHPLRKSGYCIKPRRHNSTLVRHIKCL